MAISQHCPPDDRPLVLASSSPRRKALLEAMGVRFTVDASNVAEDIPDGETIGAAVQRLAEAKAADVAQRYDEALVVAADTLVEIDGRTLTKPRDVDEARAFLRLLGGRKHRVHTGVVVRDAASGLSRCRVVESDVLLRRLAADELEAYLLTGEPLDKAGAYGIQGIGATIVERVEGEYANVVGLPLVALNQLLGELGACLICRHLRDQGHAMA